MIANKSYDGLLHVALEQITPKNVAELKPVCMMTAASAAASPKVSITALPERPHLAFTSSDQMTMPSPGRYGRESHWSVATGMTVSMTRRRVRVEI